MDGYTNLTFNFKNVWSVNPVKKSILLKLFYKNMTFWEGKQAQSGRECTL